MQNSSFYPQIKTQVQQPQQQFPEQEHLKCPRCDSENTKFCYYNNYNLSQPRHFCKSCKRYWTKGGALRKIPVGGASRKNAKLSSAKRPAAAAAAAAVSVSAPDYKNDSKTNSGDHEMAETMGENFAGQFGNFGEVSESLSSILGSSEGQFGNLFDGLGPNNFTDSGAGQNVERPMGLESGSSNNGDGFLSFQGGGESGHWSGDSNSWPDLAIYTPGSTFSSAKGR